MTSCSVPALLKNIPFYFWRLEKAASAATEDYTNTYKSASTVTHSRGGLLSYATSYHLQRLCKTEKKRVESGAGHEEGVPRAGETKEGQTDSPTRLSSRHTEVRKSHGSHSLLVFSGAVSSTLSLLSVPQWHFTNIFWTILKNLSSFGFWLTD